MLRCDVRGSILEFRVGRARGSPELRALSALRLLAAVADALLPPVPEQRREVSGGENASCTEFYIVKVKMFFRFCLKGVHFF